MTWAYRPDVSWTLIRGSGADLDLTPWVLAWEVTYGAAYDPGSGRWTVQSAVGRLRLDNADRRFDLTASAALITSQMVSIPQPVQVAIGGVVAWRGLALIRAQLPLRAGSTVEWGLRGRYWQQLRRLMTWLPRLSSGVLPGLSVHETARQLLRDTLGEAISSPSLDVTSSVSGWPTRIKLRDVAIDETGGQAWNRLAHAAASIPFEDRFGRLGMAALSQAAAGRITAYPAGLRPLDDGELTTEGTMALWGLDVAATDITAGVVETLVTTPQGGVTRKVTARYDLPADVKAVRWATPTPTAAAGWSIVDSESYPAPDRSRADIVSALLRKDVSSAQPSGVNFRGAKLTADGEDLIYPVDVVPYSTARIGQQQRQQTPPWLDPSAGPPDLRDYAALLQFVNEQKVRFSLTYPLWAESQSQALPIQSPGRGGFFVPGVTTRFPVGDGVEVDGLIASVRFAGGRRVVPTATVDGWTYSGSSGKFGLPITPAVWPKPFDVPEPQPNVPTLTLDDVQAVVNHGNAAILLTIIPFNSSELQSLQFTLFAVPGGDATIDGNPILEFMLAMQRGVISKSLLGNERIAITIGDAVAESTISNFNLSTAANFGLMSREASFDGLRTFEWRRDRPDDRRYLAQFAGLAAAAASGAATRVTLSGQQAAGQPVATPSSVTIASGALAYQVGGRSEGWAARGAVGELLRASGGTSWSPIVSLSRVPGSTLDGLKLMAWDTSPADFTIALDTTIGTDERTTTWQTAEGWTFSDTLISIAAESPARLLDWINDIDPKPDTASFELTVTRK